ncbi:MAG: glycosidase [Clostridia bacterium]|nr:glycosidase [Clostridia bacterium]
MVRLRRLSDRPVLQPIPEHRWERSAVFNCAAVYRDNVFHLIYRASDLPGHDRYGPYVSTMGHAVSLDGVSFARLSTPAFEGEGRQELRGVEDPRIAEMGGAYYMMYTAFGGSCDEDYRVSMASSPDLRHWTRHGVVLDEPNKDAALFPARVGGRYAMFHRRWPDIWIAFSDDLSGWCDHTAIMHPIPGTWESERIGIAGPPFRVDGGWALIYHGVDPNNAYRLGWALLDPENPTKVIHRQSEPILEPELEWEREGWVSNVVFSCGQIVTDGKVYVYYGAADTCIGVAVADVAQFK